MDKWDRLAGALRKALPGLEVLKNEPMARYTTFRIGGPAALFVRPRDPAEAAAVLRCLGAEGVRPFFLGNGSNLLVQDEGYDGVVMALKAGDGEGDFGSCTLSGTEVTAGAGILLSRLSRLAADAGLTGLEFAAGIPGTLGGAVTMNAGAYGGEMAGVLTSVTYLDEGGEEHTLPAAECALSYRHSLFSDHPRWLITGAKLSLEVGEREAIEAHMADLAARRREKQPLDLPSAGSTFKRPAPVDGTPVYAAALIDQCGCKGLQVGGAKVSEKHAGFVVNAGGATCKDVLELMEEVKKRVLEATGILLEPEVKVLK